MSHRYQVLTLSCTIQRLIPTKSLGAIEQDLWADINIPTSIKQVALALAAERILQVHGLEYRVNAKGCVVQGGIVVIGKVSSVQCHRNDHDCGNLSSLAIRTELALVEKPRQKRARVDTV